MFPHSYRTEHTETITSNSIYGNFHTIAKRNKIKVQPQLLDILHYIDSNQQRFKEDLGEAVQIKSCPAKLKYRNEMTKMKTLTQKWLNDLGIKNESYDTGYYKIGDVKLRIPPVILGRLGNDPEKPTLCIYLYIDVADPEESEWTTDPWTLLEKHGKFYGVGTATSKSQLLCWLHAIEAFQQCNIELPVNFKFVIESVYTLHSPMLMKFLMAKRQDFFYNIEYVICSNSEWLSEKYPCIIYGCVGIMQFTMTLEKVEGSSTNIEDDVNTIFDNLVDKEDNILIPKFNDYVDQITPDEELIYSSVKGFNPEDIKMSLPPHKQSWDKIKLLMNFWRLPSFLVDDIQRCICEDSKTPMIKRDFTIKIVPKQVVNQTEQLVKEYVQEIVKKFKIRNKVTCILAAAIRPWLENLRSELYQAARRATMQIYKEDPDMIREDRSRLILTIFNMVFEKPILLLPLVSSGANKLTGDENITKRNYYEGTKLIAAFILQMAHVKK